ncbi:BRCT domain-containing protein [Gorgonomyces haynaldii]|nr:BRCT domain-containing protein [Gorgonomyces haynaldii]
MTQVTSVQFSVGKLDAGMALLLSPDHHIIEFPSAMLPDGISPGNVVNMTIERNLEQEDKEQQEFEQLQQEIHQLFSIVPKAPEIAVKATTQTTVIIQWQPLSLFGSTFRSLDVYKNGTKLSLPLTVLSTSCKISGLDINQEYQIWVVLRTSAGQYKSNALSVKTHAMDNLTGLLPCFGQFQNDSDLDVLIDLVERIGAKYTDELSQENTHLVCSVAKGPKYERAQELNIPIVTPEFLKACEQQHKIQPAHLFYLK